MFNPPTPIELVFLAVTRCHRGVFGKFLARRNRETIAQLSYNRDFRWFGLLRPRFAIYWFQGSGGLREMSRPRSGPQTGQKRQKWIFLVLEAVLGETPADQI